MKLSQVLSSKQRNGLQTNRNQRQKFSPKGRDGALKNPRFLKTLKTTIRIPQTAKNSSNSATKTYTYSKVPSTAKASDLATTRYRGNYRKSMPSSRLGSIGICIDENMQTLSSAHQTKPSSLAVPTTLSQQKTITNLK